MTPKEMVEAPVIEFDAMANSARKMIEIYGQELKGSEILVAHCNGQASAYRHAAESLRKLLALKGWE